MRILAILMFLTSIAKSEVVYVGASGESVELLYGSSTVIKFQADVRSISQVREFKVKPLNDKDPDYSVMSVTPRSKGAKGRAVFVLADESVYKIDLKSVRKPTSQTDVYYEIRDFSELESKSYEDHLNNVGPKDLLRSMITSTELPGFHRKKIRSEKVNYGKVTTRLTEVIEGESFTGLKYIIENESNARVVVAPSQIKIGNPYKPLFSTVSRRKLSKKGMRGSRSVALIVAIRRGARFSAFVPLGFHGVRAK